MSSARPLVPARGAQRAFARGRIEAALARRTVRDRWALDLLLLEGLRPHEVAAAVDLSPRHIERTYHDFMSECARLVRASGRARTRRVTRRAA